MKTSTSCDNMVGQRVPELNNPKDAKIPRVADIKSNVVIKKAKALRNGVVKNSSIEIIEDRNSKTFRLGVKNEMKKKIKVIETKNLRASKTTGVKGKELTGELAGRGGARRSVVSKIEDNKESCNGDVTMHYREKKNSVTYDEDSTDCLGKDGAEKSFAAALLDGKYSYNVDVATNYRGKDAKNSVTDDGRRSSVKRTLVAEIEDDKYSCNGDVAMRYQEKRAKNNVADNGEFSKSAVHRVKIKGNKDVIVCGNDEAIRDNDELMCRKESISCNRDAVCRKKEREFSTEPNRTDMVKIVKNRGRLQNSKSTAKSKISLRKIKEAASGTPVTKRKNSAKAEQSSMKYSKNCDTSSANNTQIQRRILANARERTRVHKLSEAFDLLRNAIPSYTADQKLSKLSILRIAISYISALGCLVDCGKSTMAKQMFAVSVDDCTVALQSEFGRAKGARRPKNATEQDDESTKDS